MVKLPFALLGLASLALAQDAGYKLPDGVVASANLTAEEAAGIEAAVNFERKNWATGSVLEDKFYTSLPSKAKSSPAGTLLNVEKSTTIENYTIAPGLALSRIVYQSKSLKGNLVPVSAYILWPYHPKNGEKKIPLVSWGHGTSGFVAECAPSHIRNLWNQFTGPYELALMGYAVVATDYAGLGVSKDANGKTILHETNASPAAGRDMLYAAQAAQAAFPDKLSKDFVVMGHSQGGAGAWAAAQEQVKAKVPGYKGAIAISPPTRPLEQVGDYNYGQVLIADYFLKNYPKLKLEDILVPCGEQTLEVLKETQGCQASVNIVFDTFLKKCGGKGYDLGTKGFAKSKEVKEWEQEVNLGNKDFRGPLLVIQSDFDENAFKQYTDKAVSETCAKYPKKNLQYVQATGIGHTSTVYGSRQIWEKWLDECFSGKGCKSEAGKCTKTTIGDKAPQPLDTYSGELNYVLDFVPELERWKVI